MCSQADECWKREERAAPAAPSSAPEAQPDDSAQAEEGSQDIHSLPVKEHAASTSDRTIAPVCLSPSVEPR